MYPELFKKMTRNRILSIALGAAMLTSGDAMAYKYVGANGPGEAGPNATGDTNGTLGAAQPRTVAAACAPAAALKNLEWNNVRALGRNWRFPLAKPGARQRRIRGAQRRQRAFHLRRITVDGWHLS